MCLQSVLCPSHPHPAPTRIATLPDFVPAPRVQLQPKQGLVRSLRREAGPSGEPPCQPPPHLTSLCLVPAGGVGGSLGQRQPGLTYWGPCWGGADKAPSMNFLLHMVFGAFSVISPHCWGDFHLLLGLTLPSERILMGEFQKTGRLSALASVLDSWGWPQKQLTLVSRQPRHTCLSC